MTTTILALALLAAPPDARTVAGTIHAGPGRPPVTLQCDDGTTYTLSFVDRPDVLSYIGKFDGKPAYVVGLYGETRVEAAGRTDTIRTLRVLFVAESVVPRKD